MDTSGIRQGSESAFPKVEYEQRVARARRLLAKAGIDVMVVTGPENIYYLTGQQTPGYYTFQALVLPVDGEPAFVVRQLEYFNFIANTFVTNAEVYQDGDQPVNFLSMSSRRATGPRNALPSTNAAGSFRLRPMKRCRTSSGRSPTAPGSSSSFGS